jgi:hypothetical protein
MLQHLLCLECVHGSPAGPENEGRLWGVFEDCGRTLKFLFPIWGLQMAEIFKSPRGPSQLKKVFAPEGRPQFVLALVTERYEPFVIVS